MIIRSKDKIWFARRRILNRDANWFLNKDYSQAIKKDQKQRMLETVIRMLQSRYQRLSTEEQDMYWDKAVGMLRLVAQYKKLTGEN